MFQHADVRGVRASSHKHLCLGHCLLKNWSCPVQGTDDLEEAMSERLQELPPPLGRRSSHSRHDGDGFSFPQDMDTDAAGPSRVSHACLASSGFIKFSSKPLVTCKVWVWHWGRHRLLLVLHPPILFLCEQLLCS